MAINLGIYFCANPNRSLPDWGDRPNINVLMDAW
jgi:hypothetical protein